VGRCRPTPILQRNTGPVTGIVTGRSRAGDDGQTAGSGVRPPGGRGQRPRSSKVGEASYPPPPERSHA
jgi:hypothetical protein